MNSPRCCRRRGATVALLVVVGAMLVPVDADAETLRVAYSDGRLNVIADGIALGDVLRAIAQQTGLQISGLDTLSEPVSISLVAVPLRDALRQLLRPRDYALIEDHASPRVLIFESKGRRSETPSPPGTAREVRGAPVQPGAPVLLEASPGTGEDDPPAGIATQYGMVAFPEGGEEAPEDSAAN